MTDKTSSQSQQKTGGAEGKSSVLEQQLARMEAWFDDLARVEEKSIESAQRAIDESSKLMKETLAYSAKMRTEWRNLALQTSRRAAEMASLPWAQ